MHGDAKSTISASSSLSSTPEPSAASSRGTSYQQQLSGPMIPPTDPAFPRLDPLPGALGLPINNGPSFSQSSPTGSGGIPFMEGLIGARSGTDVPVPPMSGGYPGSSSFGGPNTAPNAFPPSPGYPMPPNRPSFGAVPPHVPATGSGLWTNGPQGHSALPGAQSSGFQLDAAVDFLQHSGLPATPNGNLMPPGPNAKIGSQPSLDPQALPDLAKPLGEALPDSIVDSLFGPPESNESGLLQGLQGLNMHGAGTSSGIWGQQGGNDIMKGLESLELGGVPSSLYSKPAAAHDERREQSRFAWGNQNAGPR